MTPHDLAQKKDQAEAWEPVLSLWWTYTNPSRMGGEAFERIFQSCETPDQFHILLSSFESFSHLHPQDKPAEFFFEEVDDSSYRLKDWIECIEAFYRWLHERERGADLKTMIGYIHCCIESVDRVSSKPDLKAVLLEMLDRFDFEGG